ncbi:inner membrane-spanning protein YciB [Undibacterium cyanobacteriorum]|uniref:Inner membrane-spanning protein YciB n=1 Tax=Undibacterium cyanobacteriorum TaxID=3073561 RepID=A0ABY9RDC7_9BURK|nr:inner membrane-spanning protein YciB [Undibacterium sp. 20NA77.5]WMW78976.1 inner membrane-spanning protein YciB [Undibacterium sp. 20NA77.5]
MKLLFDIFPVIIFFVTYNIAGKFPTESQKLAIDLLGNVTSNHSISLTMGPILLATGLSVISSVIQVLYLKLRKQEISILVWMTFFIILIFGGATIYFQNDTFIKLKPTIILGLNAVAFLVSDLVFGKNLMKMTMQEALVLPDNIWRKCNFAFAIFTMVMALMNLYVAFNYSQSTWVSYKLYSLAALPVFFVIMIASLSKYLPEQDNE